jgi:hypothetical protein
MKDQRMYDVLYWRITVTLLLKLLASTHRWSSRVLTRPSKRRTCTSRRQLAWYVNRPGAYSEPAVIKNVPVFSPALIWIPATKRGNTVDVDIYIWWTTYAYWGFGLRNNRPTLYATENALVKNLISSQYFTFRNISKKWNKSILKLNSCMWTVYMYL